MNATPYRLTRFGKSFLFTNNLPTEEGYYPANRGNGIVEVLRVAFSNAKNSLVVLPASSEGLNSGEELFRYKDWYWSEKLG
jgi:hypothetical protein